MSRTVLLIDDHPSILRVARRMLHRMGHTVLEADAGRPAVELFHERADDIDVVILDLGLPDMDGTEVLARLRAHRPDTRVIVSSGANPGARGLLDGPGRPDGFLDKPYTLQTLRAVLDGGDP